MRILVISDSHGRNDDVAGVIRQVGDIDMLIHCGDVERGDDYIRSLVDCPVYMVSGNNDYNLDLPPKVILQIENYKVMVVHGHMYHVYRDTRYLKKVALENQVRAYPCAVYRYWAGYYNPESGQPFLSTAGRPKAYLSFDGD